MMRRSDTEAGLSRRSLLIGGGIGAGLIVAWSLWPRVYPANLVAAPGEHVFGAWLKIGEDGHVTAVVPQAELGQGVYTLLPQILADELGADWRTVAVEPAPLNPAYANPLGHEALFEVRARGMADDLVRALGGNEAHALTGGSSSVRAFEGPIRRAAAAARVLLCKAAARRWDADWTACETAGGFVVRGDDRLRFGELAADAAGESVPDPVPLRTGESNRLVGRSLPRFDLPAKVDGSANFAGDIRLPRMVFASIRQGPVGENRLVRVNRAAAERVRGVVAVVENPRWVAAVASDWWAANRALDALAPRFETRGPLVNDASIARALQVALDGPGERIGAAGDVSAAFRGGRLVSATYGAGFAVHATPEPMTATANFSRGRLEMWLATQAPGPARAAAAAAAGLSADRVTLYSMMAGGSFGAKLEHQVAAQAAILAVKLERPVQVMWSRTEDLLHDRYRPPALARMTARLGPNGAILGWQARIAAPATGDELAERLTGAGLATRARGAIGGSGDAYAVAGAIPPYSLPAMAIDHHPADIGVPTGQWRSGAHSYTAFFTECFIDELSRQAAIEPLSFRIAMLGGDPRLARCLSAAASLAGWDGGAPGTGQGLACHSFRGSRIAVVAEAAVDASQRVAVERLIAVADCGRIVNPDIARQQIEGGLIFGLAAALGASTGFTENLADARNLGALALPRLADTPEIVIELIGSDAEPGGIGELGVPAVAPAIANALFAASGTRLRRLPLVPGGE